MPSSRPSEQEFNNHRFWRTGDHVSQYANRQLLPVEALILVRYRQLLSGRVLDVGCGGGRVLGYLSELGGEVHGVDLSPAMVDYCRRTYPEADVRVGDLAALAVVVDPPFDAIIAAGNLIDVYGDVERRRVLGSLRELIAPEGRLIFSSHNLANLDREAQVSWAACRARRGVELLTKLVERPADVAGLATRIARRRRNHRRLAPLEHRAADHAIVNDEDLDYGLVHYYIGRDDQARQLAEAGYALVECLDPDGREVAAGEAGRGPWLHYVARPE